MQNNQPLPPGFIPVEDAIALIRADKREDATVDLQFLVNNLPYLQTKHNYNIRRLKTVTDEKTGQRGTVRAGTSYVHIATDYDREILRRAIQEAFEARTSIKLREDATGVNKVSTMLDYESGNTMGKPRLDTSSVGAKEGDDISRPYEQVLNGV